MPPDPETPIKYRSISAVDMRGAPSEIGHLIGLAAIVTRLIEAIAGPDRDKIMEVAGLMLRQCVDDIDKKWSEGATAKDQAEAIAQAKAAVMQVLMPLTEMKPIQ
jgi:hypothetical protein